VSFNPRSLLALLALLAAATLAGPGSAWAHPWPQSAALTATASAPAELSLERIHADPPLAGRAPRAAALSPSGAWVTFLQPSASDSEVMELWAQPSRADAEQGESRRLVSVADLIGEREPVLTEAEKMALERRRLRGRGILRYSWCGSDERQLIVPLAGDLYLVELREEGPQAKRLTRDEAQPEMEPRCDASGRQVAYVKGGDLWVMDVRSLKARRLTQTASKTRFTGLAEFIAEEELGRHQGFWWSPDGKRLLALEVDESAVGLRLRPRMGGQAAGLVSQRYPAAGEANAKVKPLVIDLATLRVQALSLPAGWEYVARAGWFADGTAWVQALSRDQKRLSLLSFDPQIGLATSLIDEQDDTWVELHDDLRELPSLQLSGKPALLWSSERSGRRQLYAVDRVSRQWQALSDQPEAVNKVLCASSSRVVFSAATHRGRGRELFEIPLPAEPDAAPAPAPAPAPAQPIDPSVTPRWRDGNSDAACERLLVTQSQWGVPAQSEVLLLGEVGQPAPSRLALASDPPSALLAQVTPEVRELELLAADGQTPLNAFYLPPLQASGKHPVIVRVYGGPGTSLVRHAYDSETPLMAYWQRLGFGVLVLDTRGMAFRDRSLTRMHHRAFGRVEVADLFAAVRQLPRLVSGVDEARIGVIGWSYGGFLAARALMDVETPLAAAVAGAPPTDWRLYDTAYTERYLGMPEGGRAQPYAHAHLMARARLLDKPLMLIHGTADDNVLFEHSLMLISALQSESKLFETVIYPGHAHGIAGRRARLHLNRSQTDFFVRHLKPESALARPAAAKGPGPAEPNGATATPIPPSQPISPSPPVAPPPSLTQGQPRQP
jgi:dipeptidyl-peptidase-4